MLTKEQIEQQAATLYLPGSASYIAYCAGAEWVINSLNNDNTESDNSTQGVQ